MDMEPVVCDYDQVLVRGWNKSHYSVACVSKITLLSSVSPTVSRSHCVGLLKPVTQTSHGRFVTKVDKLLKFVSLYYYLNKQYTHTTVQDLLQEICCASC